MLREHGRRSRSSAIAEVPNVEQMTLGRNIEPAADRFKHAEVRLMPDEVFSRLHITVLHKPRLTNHLSRFSHSKHLHAVAVLRNMAAGGYCDLIMSRRIREE